MADTCRSSAGWLSKRVEVLSGRITQWAGSTTAFLLAVMAMVIWVTTGPFFHFDSAWQLVINTGTTIVTFLMVFLIQRAQNKDAAAIHLKLNELVAAVEGASNRLIDVEALSEEDLAKLSKRYEVLTRLARKESTPTASHSIEEARALPRRKHQKASERSRSH